MRQGLLERVFQGAGPALVGIICLSYIQFLHWKTGFPAVYNLVKDWHVRDLQGKRQRSGDLLVQVFDFCTILFPKQSLCFTYTAAITCYLRYFGYPAQMIIGVTTRPFTAHSWVKCETVRCWNSLNTDAFTQIDCI
jgi:transglutaminase superfamily protein